MSFAATTKKELTQLEHDDCCARAELSALIRMNGSLSFGNQHFGLDVTTENAAIARRIYILIKKVISNYFYRVTCTEKDAFEKK